MPDRTTTWCLLAAVGDHDGREENVEQLTWQLIWYDKHSHEHMRRPIGRILDLETFWGEMFCGSLYSTGQKSLIAVEDCWATCLICPALWLLWLLCMAMTLVIIYGSKTEFADVCHIHPWTISMHVPGTSLAWSRLLAIHSRAHHISPWYIIMLIQGYLEYIPGPTTYHPGTSHVWPRAVSHTSLDHFHACSW